MVMAIHKVLQDTRNPDNRNMCATCGGWLKPLAYDITSAYGVYVFECSQCGGYASLLTEFYSEDDTLKTAKA